MTIGTIVVCLFISITLLVGAIILYVDIDPPSNSGIFFVVGTIALIAATWFGGHWYCNNTASGIRSMTDQKAELGNGLNRTVTVYTADGQVIAQYTGHIDIEDNDGGYILFDYDGKRYTYYNCFVESIADID